MLDTKVMVGLYHVTEELHGIYMQMPDDWRHQSQVAIAIGADWMEDVGGNADDVDRVAAYLFDTEAHALWEAGVCVAALLRKRTGPWVGSSFVSDPDI